MPRNSHAYEPKADAVRKMHAILTRIAAVLHEEDQVLFTIDVRWFRQGHRGVPTRITWSNQMRLRP